MQLFTPPQSTAAEPSDNVLRSSPEEEKEEQEKFNKMCETIYGYLIGCLGMDPIKRINNHNVKEGDGISAWEALEREYNTGSKTNKRKLIQQLSNLKMEGKLRTLSAYIYEFKRIVRILEAQGIVYQTEVQVTMLLSGLRREYQPVKNLLNITPWASVAQVYEQLKLFQETNHIDDRSRTPNYGRGLNISRKNKPYRNKSNSSKTRKNMKNKVMKCFNCGKMHKGGEFECKAKCKICGDPNHVRYNCPKRKRNKKTSKDNQPWRNRNDHKTALTTNKQEEEEELMTFGLTTTSGNHIYYRPSVPMPRYRKMISNS